jgi:hypothetical protein
MQLVEAAGVRPHQQVNQICRRFEAAGVLRRDPSLARCGASFSRSQAGDVHGGTRYGRCKRVEASFASTNQDKVIPLLDKTFGKHLSDSDGRSGCQRQLAHHSSPTAEVAKNSRVSATTRLLKARSLTCFEGCIGLPFSL